MVVMTTEVLRNMMYAGSPTLRGLGFVVMDEVHYLADRFRGAVWEEVIIHLPEDVAVVSLSATVSNAEEFGAWLGEVRGDTEVIVAEHRPVPLWQHMMVGQGIYDLFVDETETPARSSDPRRAERLGPGQPRAAATRCAASTAAPTGAGAWSDAGGPRRPAAGKERRGPRRATGRRRGGGRFGGGPSRAEVIERLDRDGLLPGDHLHLQPGRLRRPPSASCWPATSGSSRESRATGSGAASRSGSARLADEDLGVLGYWEFVEGLSRGFAAHHAGMLPTFREIVEELFTDGPDPRRLRHRDAGARHQHAGAHRRARAAGQVQRRDPRRHHARPSTPS